jgi:hypothetical protein
MRPYTALLLVATASAQIRMPQIGPARFGDGSVRRVAGVTGSLVSSQPVMDGVLRFAASDRLSVAKLAESVRVFDANGGLLFESEAPSGPAVIGFSRDGMEALVYFTDVPALARCSRFECEALDIVPPPEVRAVSLALRGVALLATGSELIGLRLRDGAIIDRRKLDSAPALIDPAGNPIILPEGADADWMASGWVCVRHADGHSSALRTSTRQMSVLSADPELSLFLYDGKGEQPVGSVFDLGSFPAGDEQQFRFRIRNNNAGAVTIRSIKLAGDAFSISSAPSLPYVLAPQNFVEVRVHFVGNVMATYSATLVVNSVEVLLRATIDAAPVVIAPGGVLSGGGSVDFGRILRKTSATRQLSVSDSGSGPLTISSIVVSGDSFAIPNPPLLPLLLTAGGSVGVDVVFQPAHSGDYTGSLNIDGRQFSLTGVAYDPPLPRPVMDAGGTSLLSAKQEPLVIRFDSASGVSGTGTLKMEFQPSAGAATDDTAVRFLSGGARIQSFQVAEGDTTVAFGSDKQILFQTGTTAGTIVFTVDLGSHSEQASVRIAPAAIAFDSVTADRTPGQITVSISGFDNSRTAGSLAFKFYNKAGGAILPELSADVVKDFQRYFAASPAAGGAFLLRASFPVTGDASAIGSVDVRMANGVDVTHLDRVAVN